VAARRTTRCCSAVALTVSLFAAAPRAADDPKGGEPAAPLALFPLQARWTLALNAPLSAPPAFDATRGFFPLSGGRLVAYDLATGKQLWLVPIETAIEPAAGGGAVFVALHDLIAAVRVEDGTIAWRLPFADALATPLVWDNGWLIAATRSGSILAYRASDGRLLWRRELESPAHARPALAADHVFVPTADGRVVSLRLQTGDVEWERRLGGAANDLLPLDDRIFVGSDDNYFYALRTSNGDKDWRWRTGADVIGRAAVDERAVYFVSLDNVLRALNRGSGVQRWKRALSMRPTAGPIYTNATLLMTGLSPTLVGFHAKDGTPAGEAAIGGQVAAPPQLVADPITGLPVVYVCRQTVEGASVVAFARRIEPELTPTAPLPDVITIPLKMGAPVASKP